MKSVIWSLILLYFCFFNLIIITFFKISILTGAPKRLGNIIIVTDAQKMLERSYSILHKCIACMQYILFHRVFISIIK